mmetsp:Transcript_10494/g.26044  ORF Transcript_10494/g.26044 Transcript_10494/m.26044 type:complete len:131 (-) Transcript_10494:350-742(-)
MTGSSSDDAGLGQFAQRLKNQAPQLLFFLSKSCTTCAAIERKLPDIPCPVPVTRIKADADSVWAPEMLNYQVERVPCFVLLDREGRAVAKTGEPLGVEHMTASFQACARLAARLAGGSSSSSSSSSNNKR